MDFENPDELSPVSISHLDRLIQVILNEKNSPEVLQYQADVVNELLGRIRKQEMAVEDLESDSKQEMTRMVFSLELKRIRYLLRLYLRTRLLKLEKFAAHFIVNEEFLSRLSPQEDRFVEEYFKLVGRHLDRSFLSQLPSDYRQMIRSSIGNTQAGNDLVASPALDSHVFCSILEDVGSVQLDEDQVVDMKHGDLFIVKYEAVATLVQDGRAVLV